MSAGLVTIRRMALVEVARVSALVIHAYFCQGAVQWHKHIDHDELFLVQQGWMVLESEWGNITLKPDEMAVMPKGVSHRSSSQLRAVVLLLQPAVAADRKNGHRRIFAIPGENELRRAFRRGRRPAPHDGARRTAAV